MHRTAAIDMPTEERLHYERLFDLFEGLPPLTADIAALQRRLREAREPDDVEEAFLALYAHVHGYEVTYTPEERERFTALGGHLNHVGGLRPLTRAAPFIPPETISADFGAGNGLQGLLLQHLYPHKKTVLVELSSQLVEAGRGLQRWLGIPEERVEWINGDIAGVSPAPFDFIYIYRPVRPTGAGASLYRRFCRELGDCVIFSVADCLAPFLPDDFEAFWSDGHLTCFRRRG